MQTIDILILLRKGQCAAMFLPPSHPTRVAGTTQLGDVVNKIVVGFQAAVPWGERQRPGTRCFRVS